MKIPLTASNISTAQSASQLMSYNCLDRCLMLDAHDRKFPIIRLDPHAANKYNVFNYPSDGAARITWWNELIPSLNLFNESLPFSWKLRVIRKYEQTVSKFLFEHQFESRVRRLASIKDVAFLWTQPTLVDLVRSNFDLIGDMFMQYSDCGQHVEVVEPGSALMSLMTKQDILRLLSTHNPRVEMHLPAAAASFLHVPNGEIQSQEEVRARAAEEGILPIHGMYEHWVDDRKIVPLATNGLHPIHLGWGVFQDKLNAILTRHEEHHENCE